MIFTALAEVQPAGFDPGTWHTGNRLCARLDFFSFSDEILGRNLLWAMLFHLIQLSMNKKAALLEKITHDRLASYSVGAWPSSAAIRSCFSFFHGSLHPHKPYGLLGTGEELGRE